MIINLDLNNMQAFIIEKEDYEPENIMVTSVTTTIGSDTFNTPSGEAYHMVTHSPTQDVGLKLY